MGRATAAGEAPSNKREAVLAAAVSCFAARGLAGAGMREIARAAGLTEGTLYHYFSSKDELIDAAFRWSAFPASSVREAMKRDAPLRERLLAVGAEFLVVLWRSADWSRVLIREALRSTAEEDQSPVRRAVVSLAAERTRALAAALREERDAGRVGPCQPRRVAELFFRALIGHFVAEAIGRPQSTPRPAADPFLAHLVDTLAADLERPAGRCRTRGGRR
jgi:AcrR family transcriptional regulator